MQTEVTIKNSLLPEFIMYGLNTLVFFIATIVYSVFIRNEDGLITILNAFINNGSPYWVFGLIFLYILVAVIMYTISIFLTKNIFAETLFQIKKHILSSFSSLGSSLSGITFATTIFVFRSSNPDVSSLGNEYLSLSILCFLLFLIGVTGFKWFIIKK